MASVGEHARIHADACSCEAAHVGDYAPCSCTGVAIEHDHKVLIQPDRYQAIKMAMRMAQANDIVLIAGKGHERYQEIKGERFEFDDVKTVKELINA